MQTCICLGQRFTNVSSENNQVLSYSVRVNVYKCLAYHVPRSDVCCGREQCFPVYSIYTDWWISHNNLYKIANERQWHRRQSEEIFEKQVVVKFFRLFANSEMKSPIIIGYQWFCCTAAEELSITKNLQNRKMYFSVCGFLDTTIKWPVYI